MLMFKKRWCQTNHPDLQLKNLEKRKAK
jgi:hypothetical protein